MTCRDIRDRLLEAEPEDLRGLGSGPLVTHLETCLDCRSLAIRWLVTGEELLMMALISSRCKSS